MSRGGRSESDLATLYNLRSGNYTMMSCRINSGKMIMFNGHANGSKSMSSGIRLLHFLSSSLSLFFFFFMTPPHFLPRSVALVVEQQANDMNDKIEIDYRSSVPGTSLRIRAVGRVWLLYGGMAIFAVNVLTASNFVDAMAAALDQCQTCQIGDLLFYLGGASTDWIVTVLLG